MHCSWIIPWTRRTPTPAEWKLGRAETAERKGAGREEFVRRGTVAEWMFITKLSIGGGSNGLLSKAADNFMCSRPANEFPSWYSYFTKRAPHNSTRRLEFLAGFKRVYLIKLQFANNGNNPVKLIFRRQDRIARVISSSRALSNFFFVIVKSRHARPHRYGTQFYSCSFFFAPSLRWPTGNEQKFNNGRWSGLLILAPGYST